MRIEVTQKRIETGQKCSDTDCAVAQSIEDALGVRASVSGEGILLRTKRGGYWCRTIKTPANVAEFIRKFDAGEDVEPFSFKLPLPPDFA